MLTSDRPSHLLPAPPPAADWPFPGRVHWVSVPGPCVWNETRNGWRASRRCESSAQPAPHTGTLAPVYTTAARAHTHKQTTNGIKHGEMSGRTVQIKKKPNLIKCASYAWKYGIHTSKQRSDLWHSRIVLQKSDSEIQSSHMRFNLTRL